MHKRTMCIVVIFVWSVLKANIFLQPRLSIGPAFHVFSTKQFFDVTIQSFFEQDLNDFEHISIYSQWGIMPYFQAQLQGLIGNHFYWEASGGTGSFKRAQSIVNHSASFNNNFYFITGKRNGLTCGSVTIFDVGIGTIFDIPALYDIPFLQINPIIGYRYNIEKLQIKPIFPVENYKIKNKWQGPYIGVRVGVDFSDFFLFSTSYKFVISKLNYLLQFDAGASRLYNVLPEYSEARMASHGNIFNIELVYLHKQNIHFGVAIDYMQYATACLKSACFPETVLRFDPDPRVEGFTVVVNKETIQSAIWQQLIWTFFIEVFY